MIHSTDGSPGGVSRHAVKFTGGASRNAAVNVLATPTSLETAIRIEDSDSNFVSVFNFGNVAAQIVNLSGSDTKRNVIEVLHPANKASIRPQITDTTGNGMSGMNGNPIFCHATGEYFGSLNNSFRWVIQTSAAADKGNKFNFETQGDNTLCMISDGDQDTVSGLTAYNPSGIEAALWYSRVSSGDNWTFRGIGQSALVQILAGSLRPGGDAGGSGQKSLGDAARRWTEVFAATGTINTSDARAKTDPLPIDDTVLNAWGDVQLVAFRWLEAVARKGELARIHHGVIAQQVRDAFAAHGLDATRYGLLCHDEWPAVDEVRSEDGEIVQEAAPAGDRWGVRADQCLFVEAAYQRRRLDRLEAKMAVL